MNFLKSILTKHIGLTINNNIITAVELKKGIYIEKSINDLFPEYCIKDFWNLDLWKNQVLLKDILDLIISKAGKSFFKPIILINVPIDLSQKQKDIFAEFIHEYKYNIVLTEDILCPIAGLGDLAHNIQKRFFVFSNGKRTYIILLFAGKIIKIKTIEKNIDIIKKEQILVNINEIKQELSKSIPEIFKDKSRNVNLMVNIIQEWEEGNIENILYIILPDETKKLYSNKLGKYKIEYFNLKQATVDGMKDALYFLKNNYSRL